MGGWCKIICGGMLCLLLVSLGTTFDVFDEVFPDDAEEMNQEGLYIDTGFMPLEMKSTEPEDLILLKLIDSPEVVDDENQLRLSYGPSVMDMDIQFPNILVLDTKEPVVKRNLDVLETMDYKTAIKSQQKMQKQKLKNKKRKVVD